MAAKPKKRVTARDNKKIKRQLDFADGGTERGQDDELLATWEQSYPTKAAQR